MKRIFLLLAGAAFLSISYTNCARQGFDSTNDSSSTYNPVGVVSYSGNNVVPINVGCGYINEPCVSVTICVPGTLQCQTINNILLDTGSYGLRLFSSVITIPLQQVKAPNGGGLAECVSYGDGTGQWGPVQVADVKLGNETASSVPIMVDNAKYATPPTDCTGLDDISTAGYNGILGVGLWQQDCGSVCANTTNNDIYFTCTGATCIMTAVPAANQVTNPVSMMPVDNNGVLVKMNSVSVTGSPSASGAMYLGIQTQPNNTPGGSNPAVSNVFGADQYANFITVFNGSSYNEAFIDSGSNGLFFPTVTSTPDCKDVPGLYCPTSTVSLSATMEGASGSPSASVPFMISNVDTDTESNSPAIGGLGGDFSGGFDWGLPFFFGRTVYVGFQGKSSSLGAHPLWAF